MNALKAYKATQGNDQYLVGLLKLINYIIIRFPTLKTNEDTISLIGELNNLLIYQCLFAVPDPSEDPLGILQDSKGEKCSFQSVRAAHRGNAHLICY